MTDAVVDEAYSFLRSHTTADLRFDENMRPIKYVIEPEGRLVAPAMVAMLRSVDTVIFVPEYADGAMELQVTLLEFAEQGVEGALADRWRIYHGDPDDVRWAAIQIDMARFGEVVIDGAALMRSNPLARHEAAICMRMNREPESLRLMCRHFGTMDVESPVMVGVDRLGFDVRARFDVVRLSAPEPMHTAEDVDRALATMTKQGMR